MFVPPSQPPNSQSERQQQLERDQLRAETMTIFLRTVNNAVKYFVVAVVFIICVTRTYPGDPGVLPAYYLISSLLLAATAKILKRILKQPRPDPESCEYHHPKKFTANTTPSGIVVGGNNKEEDSKTQEEGEEAEEARKEEEEDDDDHGMPSSHSAMVSYFSWTANFALFVNDAFKLTSRAWSGLFGVFLPLMQLMFEGSGLIDLFLSQQRKSELDILSSSNTRHSEALSFVVILLCLTSTLFLAGVFGAQLRVWNGDHTVGQALVGYILGFLWACASVALEVKVFKVNSQSLQVQGVWMGTAIVLGLIGAFLILRNKNKNRLLRAQMKKERETKKSS